MKYVGLFLALLAMGTNAMAAAVSGTSRLSPTSSMISSAPSGMTSTILEPLARHDGHLVTDSYAKQFVKGTMPVSYTHLTLPTTPYV